MRKYTLLPLPPPHDTNRRTEDAIQVPEYIHAQVLSLLLTSTGIITAMPHTDRQLKSIFARTSQ